MQNSIIYLEEMVYISNKLLHVFIIRIILWNLSNERSLFLFNRILKIKGKMPDRPSICCVF